MKVDENGLELTLFKQNFNEKLDSLSKNYGEKFDITAESLISNLIIAVAIMQTLLERNIAFLLKQFDPETAEGKYQDAIYERIALERIVGKTSSFDIKLRGISNAIAESESIVLQDINTYELFCNTYQVVFDENGYANVNFHSLIEDNISISSEFRLYDAPGCVIEVVPHTCENIVLGNKRETDVEFRERFRQIRTVRAKSTHNDLLNNLSELTGGIHFIKILDVNTNPEISAGTVEIIAKPVVSDEIFCKAILDNTMAGINFSGNTTVMITLSNGQEQEVAFYKAVPVPILIQITVKLKFEIYPNPILQKIKENIVLYSENKTYGLGDNVISNEFISTILEVNGVEGLASILVKRQGAENYSGEAEILQTEYATFDISNINILQEE